MEKCKFLRPGGNALVVRHYSRDTRIEKNEFVMCVSDLLRTATTAN